MTEATQETPQPQYTDSAAYNASQAFVLKLIWGFMIFGNTGFALGGYPLINRRTLQLKPEMLQVLLIASIALCIITALLVFGVVPIFRKKLNYMLYCLLRWALTGSGTVYGFVLFMLGKPYTYLLGFILWDVLLLLLLFPKKPEETNR